jgi:uncharacterized protein
MAAIKVLCDTGPLVAYFSRGDAHHAWAIEQWDGLSEPVITCEAVLSEALFHLQDEHLSIEPLLEVVGRGLVRLDFDAKRNWISLEALLRKYRDQAMSLADASLVRMSELFEPCRVFTTDSDFRVYRRNSRQVIPLIAPF